MINKILKKTRGAHGSHYKANRIKLNFQIRIQSKKAPIHNRNRRRMESEAKAKVVASDLGADVVKFLAALAVLP